MTDGPVFVANRVTGCFIFMTGISPRDAVLGAYVDYELASMDSVDREAAYGPLIAHADDETAALDDWLALIREEDLAGNRCRTLAEAQARVVS